MEPARVEHHNDGYRTRYTIIADDKIAVLEAIERVKRAYHPLGYGTSFSEPTLMAESGRWTSHGSRSNSCD